MQTIQRSGKETTMFGDVGITVLVLLAIMFAAYALCVFILLAGVGVRALRRVWREGV